MHLRAATALVALSLLACSPELDWREVSSSEGRFSALLPARPRYESRTLSGEGVTMHLWSAQAGKSVFGVGYADYPAAGAGILDATRIALVANIRGRLVEESPVSRNGLAGRSLVAESGDNLLRAQLLLSGNRLYQLAVLGPRNALNPADLDLFFSSFSPRNARN